MILPIVAYGSPVLKEMAKEIAPNYPELKTLIANMKKTMHNARGVGLAAPQIGKSIRLFIIDASPFANDESLSEKEQKMLVTFKHIFINPIIIKQQGELWNFNEGCLSIPEVREDISRQQRITITYQDENFKEHSTVLEGLAARIFQHEYDHIEGILFTDRVSSLKKRLLKRKLQKIAEGKIKVGYAMVFPKKKI